MTLRTWSTLTGGARNLFDHWRRADPDAANAALLASRRALRDDENPRVTVDHKRAVINFKYFGPTFADGTIKEIFK